MNKQIVKKFCLALVIKQELKYKQNIKNTVKILIAALKKNKVLQLLSVFTFDNAKNLFDAFKWQKIDNPALLSFQNKK